MINEIRIMIVGLMVELTGDEGDVETLAKEIGASMKRLKPWYAYIQSQP